MKYVGLVQWAVQDGDIQLDMLGEDQEVHRVAVSAECAGVLLGALAAETEKLRPDNRDLQFIRPTGMQTGKTHQGEPVLFMTLKGGTELPLVFKAESLGLLISELEKLRGVLQPGGQVRWQ